jgi:hypothetical protein
MINDYFARHCEHSVRNAWQSIYKTTCYAELVSASPAVCDVLMIGDTETSAV